ncbi:MAG: bifunctional phosphoribosylaminoimidazolecarboxamide formyltransferase/IMP cyclohydrolase [Bacteroidales bacterium]
MADTHTIKSALISVYNKKGLAPLIEILHKNDIALFSTGGTLDYINNLGVKAVAVEDLTKYPSIFGGRVKTLHPKIFGGILAQRSKSLDKEQLLQYEIPEIDLVIVDLYPFEETLALGKSEDEIIEKIDIGGVSLIRAAAKNFNDVAVISSPEQYSSLIKILECNNGATTLEDRRRFALQAFGASSHYDMAIFSYFNSLQKKEIFRYSVSGRMPLRYGENPHQTASFYGDFDSVFEQLHGKEISYNNLLDIDAGIALIAEFTLPTFAVLKHNNACGLATRTTLLEAWKCALAGDPISAFGGVIVCNQKIDKLTANEINALFCEVVIAPAYDNDALMVLKQKKNRILLVLKTNQRVMQKMQLRTLLNGVAVQSPDNLTVQIEDMCAMTTKLPNSDELKDLVFANKIVKHSKSNAIVLVKDEQLVASGVGQTSRIDALQHAIKKAQSFGFSLQGAVMASDAFFPFGDCVEIAYKAGITAVVQPGGSINDKLSVDFCNEHQMSMMSTSIRHFKH